MNQDIWDAIEHGDLPRLIGLLDEAGDDVDLDAHDDQGNTALAIATGNGFPEIVELLLSRGASPDVLRKDQMGRPFRACLHDVSLPDIPNQLEIAQILIRYGASVNVLCSSGYTPLLVAVEWHRHDMVDFLLRHGADPLLGSSDTDSLTSAIEKFTDNDVIQDEGEEIYICMALPQSQ